MYIPNDLINIIFSFLSFCNNCKISFIDEDYFFDYNNNFICFRCKDNFKLCQSCQNLYQTTIYCNFCQKECKYLCYRCVPK